MSLYTSGGRGGNEKDRVPQAMGGSAEELHFPENDAEYDVDSSDEDLDGMEAGESSVVSPFRSVSLHFSSLRRTSFVPITTCTLFFRRKVLTRIIHLGGTRMYAHTHDDAQGVL